MAVWTMDQRGKIWGYGEVPKPSSRVQETSDKIPGWQGSRGGITGTIRKCWDGDT